MLWALSKSDTFGRRMNVSGLSEGWAFRPAYELKLALIAASAQCLFLQCCHAAKTWDPCAILRRSA